MAQDTSTITVSLPTPLKEKIEARIASGDFGNTSEYFRTLARADLENQEKLKRLRVLIQEGIDGLEQGEGVELTPERIADIKAQGRERLAEGNHA